MSNRPAHSNSTPDSSGPEVAHDAAIYRMYQAEAAQIEKRGGTIKRVVLECELMKNLYRSLAKARRLSALEYTRRQAEVAADNRLKWSTARFRGPICDRVRNRTGETGEG